MDKTRARSLLLALAFASVMAVPAQAQLFGPSDEEVAAERAHEDAQDNRMSDQDERITTLSNRVRDLEDSLRQATGRNEVLDNRVSQLTQQIERQQRDFEYRLCTLTAQQLGASTDPASGGINCAAATASTSAVPPVQQSPRFAGGAVQLAPPPGVLGTLPSGSGPQGNQARFDAAMNMLARNQLNEASAAFRSYADTYPDDSLAPQAVHWVGVIAFTQNDYTNAARTFAEGIKKYPNSTRGPDSMLKLGQSLIAMGQKNEGCTTLGAIKAKYPTASASVLDQATIERRNAACR